MDIEDIINKSVTTDWKPILIKLLEPHKNNINFLLNYNTIDKEMFEILQHKEAVSEAVNKGVDIASKSSNLKQILKKMLQKK